MYWYTFCSNGVIGVIDGNYRVSNQVHVKTTWLQEFFEVGSQPLTFSHMPVDLVAACTLLGLYTRDEIYLVFL